MRRKKAAARENRVNTRPDFSLWIISPDKQSVRRFRLSKRYLVGSAVALGITLGLVVCLVSDYARVLMAHASEAYQAYLLESEKNNLALENERLRGRVAELENDTQQAAVFQAQIKQHMDELYSAVESATGLAFNAGPKRAEKRNIKRRGDKVEEGAEDGKKGLAELRELNKGLGGAEIECRRTHNGKIKCLSSAGEEEVRFEEVRASLSPQLITADHSSWAGEPHALVERMNSYVKLLRSIPAGSPCEGDLSSGFGIRQSPFTRRKTMHEGLDISLDRGSRVHATADGRIAKVERDSTYGNMIDIDHGNGIVTRYAHLSKVLVKVGSKVKRGDVIAASGSTGRSTGPHLHYEVRVDKRARNPMPFLALAQKLKKFL